MRPFGITRPFGKLERIGNILPFLLAYVADLGKSPRGRYAQIVRAVVGGVALIASAGCVSDNSEPSPPYVEPPRDYSWAVGKWASVNPGAPSEINYWFIENRADSGEIVGRIQESSGASRPFQPGSKISGAEKVIIRTIDTASTCNDIWESVNAFSRAYCLALDTTKAKYKPRLLSWEGYYWSNTEKIEGEAKVSWNGGITWTAYVYPFVAQKSK